MYCKMFKVICLLLVSHAGALDFTYHKYDEMADVLINFSLKNPNVFPRMYSVGKSVEGRDLWVVEVTTANRSQNGIPNVKLIGNIHGNEAVGREVLLHFLEYLGKNYKIDPIVTSLLDNTRIHIMPSMNPDGFEMSSAGICDNGHGRENAKKQDLNRNFEDFYVEKKRVVQPETEAIEKWMEDVPFILSGSLHGGALVANYPFDTVKELKWETLLRELTENGNPELQQKLRDSYIASFSFNPPSISPDNDVFVHLATTYASTHTTMHLGQTCPNSNRNFTGGITNGAAWYPFRGGMQDYNYVKRGCMELTLEISCCKYPPNRELEKLWNENKNALVEFIKQANQGVRGFIYDKHTSKSISSVTLRIVGRDMNFTTSKKGEFWRILLPGTYELQVNAVGYHPETVSFFVANSTTAFPKLTTLYVPLINETIPRTSTTQLTPTSPPAIIFSTTYEDGNYSEFLRDQNKEQTNDTVQRKPTKLNYVDEHGGKEALRSYTIGTLTLVLCTICWNF